MHCATQCGFDEIIVLYTLFDVIERWFR